LRSVLRRARDALRFGVSHEHERPGWRIDLVAADLEARMAAEHEVELLVSTGAFLMALDHLVAARASPGARAESVDVELMPDRGPVRPFLGGDVVESCCRVRTHAASWS
jgi:hypothetical protein